MHWANACNPSRFACEAWEWDHRSLESFLQLPGKEELSFANIVLFMLCFSLIKKGVGMEEEILSSMSGSTLGIQCMELHCLLQALLLCYACNLSIAECQIPYTIMMAPTQSHLEPLVILKQNSPFLFKHSQQFNYAKYFSPQESLGCWIKQPNSIFSRNA